MAYFEWDKNRHVKRVVVQLVSGSSCEAGTSRTLHDFDVWSGDGLFHR